MSMDLQELKFKVDTTELKDAADKVGALVVSVNNLKSSLKNIPNVTMPNVPGSGSGGSSGGGAGTQKSNSALKSFNTLMQDLTDLQRDLVDGFTRGESGWLKQARAIQLNADQMDQYKRKIREVSELFKDPFDSSLGSIRAVTKEFDRLTTRADLLKKGVYLSTNQLKEFSRLSTEIKGAMLAEGKKVNSKGMFEGNDLVEYTRKLEIVRESYLKTAAANNALEQAEKLRLKDSIALEREKARLLAEGESMMTQAVTQFRKNEIAKQNEMERTIRITEELQQKTAFLKQGYSRGEATALVSGMSKGVDKATIDNLIQAQRAQGNALGSTSGASDGAAKSARDLARANQYLIDVEARLDEALKHTNDTMDRRSTDQLVKIRNALKVTGVATEEAGGKFDILSKKVEKVASKEQQRRLDYLARAISVQMGDVGISLASGMNPLLVMIQQGDQIRGAIQQAGAKGKELEKAMSTAAVQIASSFRDTAKAIGGFFVSAIVGAGDGIANLSIKAVGGGEMLRKFNNELLVSSALGNTTATSMLKLGESIKIGIGVASAIWLATMTAVSIELIKVMRATTELNQALVLTGANIGMSKDQMQKYAESMDIVGSNTLKVIRVISQIVGKTDLPKNAIKGVTQAVIDLEKYGGQAADKTIEQFDRLSKEPTKALTELALKTGLVSASTIEYVTKLEDQGNKTKAATIAIEAYRIATVNMSNSLRGTLSPLEKLWLDIKNAIDEAKESLYKFATNEQTLTVIKTGWGAVKILFTAISLVVGDLIRNIGGVIQAIGAVARIDLSGGVLAGFAGVKEEIDGIADSVKAAHEESQNSLRNTIDETFSSSAGSVSKLSAAQQKADAATKKVAALQVKSYSDLNDLMDKAGAKTTKLANELNALYIAKAKVAATGKSLSNEDEKRFADAEKAIRERYKSTGDKSSEQFLKQARDAYIEAAGAVSHLTKNEEAYLKMQSDEKWKEVPARIKKDIKVLFDHAIAIEKDARAKEEQLKINKVVYDQIEKETEARSKLDDVIRELFVSSKELSKVLQDDTARLALETNLLFSNEETRKKTLKTFESEIVLRKELDAIKKKELDAILLAEQSGATGLNKDQIRAFEDAKKEAEERGKARLLNINTEIVNDQMKKWVDMYNNLQSGVADAISTALFDGGKAGRKKLRDIIVQELRKPFEIYIKAGVELLTQGAGGFLQALSGNTNAGSNATSSTINGISAGSKAAEWGSKVYGGYQSGGLSGAWSAGTGASSAGSSVLATTDIGVGAASAGTGTSTAAGTSAGMYALYAAAIYAGVKKAMSDWDAGFRTDSAKQLNKETGLGGMEYAISTVMQKIGINQKWADLFSGVTALTKHLGMGAAQAEDSGVQGTFGGGTFEGKAFQDMFQKGGLLRESKWWTDLSTLDSDIQNLMVGIASETRKSITDYADTLGLAITDIDAVRTNVKIALTDKSVRELSDKYGEDLARPFEELSEEGKRIAQSSEFSDAVKADQDANLKEIIAAAESYSDAMIGTFAAELAPFTKYGEKASEVITRMSINIKAANTVMEDLGLTVFDASLKGAEAAGNFIELFGSIENFNSAFSSYYDNFYTAEEKIKLATDGLTKQFTDLGLALPKSTESFRKLVEVADAAGDKTLVGNLIKLAPAFVEIQKAVSDLTEKVSSNDVKDAFFGMLDNLFKGEQLKSFRVLEIVDNLATAGITVSDSMVLAATSTQVLDEALAYFNQGMYDKALALINIIGKLSKLNTSATAEQALEMFSGMADKLLNSKDLKDFRLGEIVTELGKAGIVVTADMLSAAKSTDVFRAAFDYFNAGLYDKAMAVLGIVDKLSSVSTSFNGINVDIEKAANLYDAARTRLKAAGTAVEKAYEAQIKGVDSQINSIQKEIDAKEKVITAAEKSVDKFTDLVDKFNDFRKAISDLRKEIMQDILGEQLGKGGSAMKGLQDAAKRAKSGDLTALQDIQKYSKEYLDVSKDNSVTFLDYAADIMKVNGVLVGVETTADAQLRINTAQLNQAQAQLSSAKASVETAQKQLEEAQASKELLTEQKDAALAQIDALFGIDASVLSVVEAISNLQAAIVGYNTDKAAADKAIKDAVVKTSGGTADGAMDYSGTKVIDTIKANLAAGYSPDYIVQQGVSAFGANESDIRNIARLAGLEGFASGGSYPGGLAMVGEKGPELINFDRPGQVYNNAQARELLHGSSSSNSISEALLQAMLAELSKSRADNAKIRQLLERLTPEGDSLVVRFVSTQDVNVV